MIYLQLGYSTLILGCFVLAVLGIWTVCIDCKATIPNSHWHKAPTIDKGLGFDSPRNALRKAVGFSPDQTPQACASLVHKRFNGLQWREAMVLGYWLHGKGRFADSLELPINCPSLHGYGEKIII